MHFNFYELFLIKNFYLTFLIKLLIKANSFSYTHKIGRKVVNMERTFWISDHFIFINIFFTYTANICPVIYKKASFR